MSNLRDGFGPGHTTSITIGVFMGEIWWPEGDQWWAVLWRHPL